MSLFDSLKKQLLESLAARVQGTGAPAGEAGAVVHHGVLAAVVEMVQTQGLGNLLQAFQSQGLGEMVSSWVSRGSNLPITAEQVHQVLGPDKIAALAKQFGLPADQISAILAKFLPGMVDHLTPNGRLDEPAEAEPSSLLPGPADTVPQSTEG
jgi:uncharacterized protein YidB (DUF937 family)